MRNRYCPWGELERGGVSLEMCDLADGLLGEYLHHENTIRCDRRQPWRQLRCTLAHELCHWREGHQPLEDPVLDARRELQVDRMTARVLIDLDDLADALVLHQLQTMAAAVDLAVTEELIRHRLNWLHHSEANHLRRRLAGADWIYVA